jgi:hypothetical protein
MVIVQTLLFVGFALVGRWFQLHSEKVVPRGWFSSENSFSARLHRAETTVIGVFAVFGGTYFALHTALQDVASRSEALSWVAVCVCFTSGIVAAALVRRQVKAQPPHKSKGPYGWWP